MARAGFFLSFGQRAKTCHFRFIADSTATNRKRSALGKQPEQFVFSQTMRVKEVTAVTGRRSSFFCFIRITASRVCVCVRVCACFV